MHDRRRPFEALRDRLAQLHGRSRALARQLGDVDLAASRTPATSHCLPVLRKSACPRCTGRAAVRRLRRRAARRVRAPVHLARDRSSRPEARRRRSLGRGARRSPPRASAATWCSTPSAITSRPAASSSSAARGARLRGDPGRPRQHRAADRPDRGISGPAPMPARRISSRSCSTRRARRRDVLLDQRRWCPARHFRHRCRTRSRRAASTPIRPSPPPTSASSPTRRRRGRRLWDRSTKTCIVEIVPPGTGEPAATARSARSW